MASLSPKRSMCFRLGLTAAAALLLVACQSTNSTETTSAIPALESAAGVETVEAPPEAVASNGGGAEPVAGTQEASATQQSNGQTVAQSESDRLIGAAVQIAGLEKEQGRNAAFRSVLACYERAKSREAPVVVAKECATQDFVISRARQEAGGQRDQQLIIAQRAPQRIGALMELKGMGQAEFNSFGLFLNRVALPAYRQAQS